MVMPCSSSVIHRWGQCYAGGVMVMPCSSSVIHVSRHPYCGIYGGHGVLSTPMPPSWCPVHPHTAVYMLLHIHCDWPWGQCYAGGVMVMLHTYCCYTYTATGPGTCPPCGVPTATCSQRHPPTRTATHKHFHCDTQIHTAMHRHTLRHIPTATHTAAHPPTL